METIGRVSMADIAEMYPVPAEIEKLHVLLGRWMVNGELQTGGETMPVSGEWEFNIAAGGWGLKSSNRLAVAGLGDYYLDNLFGYDRETGTMHVYSLTNMAETHDHVMAWTGDDEIRGYYEGPRDGKPFREDFYLTFKNPSELTIRYVEKADGKLDSMMELVLRKAGPGGQESAGSSSSS